MTYSFFLISGNEEKAIGFFENNYKKEKHEKNKTINDLGIDAHLCLIHSKCADRF